MSEYENTPIIKTLRKYIDTGIIRFHMPGHKGNPTEKNSIAELLGNKVFAADVTNVPVMDDLHQAHSVIKEAQELAAKTFGADFTYFLINGSSCGLQALLMAVCEPGDKVLIPRNMHRSILSGIILSGSIPVYFKTEYDCEQKIPLGTCPETIAQCLQYNPDIKAVLLVNPTYHGISSDITAIARIVHDLKIPLLVDEAHGPHLCFHQDLPAAALECGADACVQGTHKVLSAFTQASMLHLKSSLINRQRLEGALRILQSTSTSYLLLASLDAARDQMDVQGTSLIRKALDLAKYIRNEVNEIEGFFSFGNELVGRPGIFGFDPLKVTISVRKLGITGLWAEDWLRRKQGIQVEMSDLFNVLLIVSFNNTLKDADFLLDSLKSMRQYIKQNNIKMELSPNIKYTDPLPLIPEQVITPREAFWAPVSIVPLAEAVGKISAETISCYPPGIPIICPGERVSTEIVDYLMVLRSVGMRFQGCHDSGLTTLLMVP